MRIALVQLRMTTDMQENFEKALVSMEQAAAEGAQLICFPEIQLSPFFPQFEGQDASHYALTLESNIVDGLRRKCRELGVVAFPNLYLQDSSNYYDATLAIEADGSILGVSKMVHVVNVPCFFEQDYYTPSDTGFQVYSTSVGRVGVVICFDRHYPESLRTCALSGAELIVVPTANAKNEPLELFDWEIRVPAVQNGVYIAMCNRVGVEDNMHFAGGSIVVGPEGEVISRASDEEELLLADLELAVIEQSRAARPYLTLRRPDTFNL